MRRWFCVSSLIVAVVASTACGVPDGDCALRMVEVIEYDAERDVSSFVFVGDDVGDGYSVVRGRLGREGETLPVWWCVEQEDD